MKAYSRSQGKIIDVPDNTFGGGTGGGAGMGMGGSAFSQGGLDVMKKMFALAALQDPKNISKYTSLIDLFSMFGPSEDELELQKSLQGGLTEISGIKEFLNTREGEDITGYMPGIKSTNRFFRGLDPEGFLGGTLGLAPSQSTNTFQARISQYNTRLFDIAGKAFTGTERDLLEGLVLDISDDEGRIMDKVQEAENMIREKMGSTGVDYLQGGTGTTGMGGTTTMPTGRGYEQFLK